MISTILRVSDAELKDFLEDSSLLEERIYDEDSDEDPDLLDLDKAWEGIFYLLTGTSTEEIENAKPPLSWAIVGDKVLDEEQDLGYGPASYNTSAQVKEISEALNAFSTKDLIAKYDGEKMMEMGIYPEIWEDEDSLSFLTEHFESLKDFYNHASKNNQAVISILS